MRSTETTSVRTKIECSRDRVLRDDFSRLQSVEVVGSSYSEHVDQSDSSSTDDQPEKLVDSIISPAVISDDSTDEENDSNVNIENFPHVIKYNQRFDNVHSISQMTDVKNGMWLGTS